MESTLRSGKEIQGLTNPVGLEKDKDMDEKKELKEIIQVEDTIGKEIKQRWMSLKRVMR